MGQLAAADEPLVDDAVEQADSGPGDANSEKAGDGVLVVTHESGLMSCVGEARSCCRDSWRCR